MKNTSQRGEVKREKSSPKETPETISTIGQHIQMNASPLAGH
jgi:hypothetical protein